MSGFPLETDSLVTLALSLLALARPPIAAEAIQRGNTQWEDNRFYALIDSPAGTSLLFINANKNIQQFGIGACSFLEPARSRLSRPCFQRSGLKQIHDRSCHQCGTARHGLFVEIEAGIMVRSIQISIAVA